MSITNWKNNRSWLSRLFRQSEPPFHRGELMRCVNPCYNAKAGEIYTIAECFESKGPDGWNWWLCFDEITNSYLASDFQQQTIGSRTFCTPNIRDGTTKRWDFYVPMPEWFTRWLLPKTHDERMRKIEFNLNLCAVFIALTCVMTIVAIILKLLK